MANWETKYTSFANINGGNKYTTDSQLTIDMFIVPIENAEYAVQKSLSAESIANSAKNKVDTLAKVASSGSYNDLTNKPTSLPASDVYAWAKASTKPTYTANEVGTYTTTEIDTKLGTKQNTIDSNNKLSYSLLKDAPTNILTLPTQNWTTATQGQLPSYGLYVVTISLGGILTATYSLGLVPYFSSSAMVIQTFYDYNGSYRAKLSSGKIILEQYRDDEYWEVTGRVSVTYIKLL